MRGPRPREHNARFLRERGGIEWKRSKLDVQLSCDGEILVFHDRDLRRLAGCDSELTTIGAAEALRIPLHDVDRGFSADGIPKLYDVVETLSPSTYIDIELKSYPNTPVTVPDAVAVAIDRLGIADRVLVSSFDPRQIRRFRAVASKFAPSLSGVLDGAIYARSNDIPWILRRSFGYFIDRCAIRKPALPCLPRHGCGPGLTIPWTVNSEEIARRLAGHGVAGIISDDPTAIRDALTPPIQA